jgi:tetratricopeptide (TPR) repeat protein
MGRSLPPPDRTVLLRGFLRRWRIAVGSSGRPTRPNERGRWGCGVCPLRPGPAGGGPASHAGSGGPLPPLAAQNPDAFLPDLARSLNNLGVDYRHVGRWSKAAQAYKRSVQIYRQLSEQGSDVSPYLARSLNNLANALLRLGWRERPWGPPRSRWRSTASWSSKTPGLPPRPGHEPQQPGAMRF